MASAANARTITVTSGNLVDAFSHARAGDTLRLVGTFGATHLQYRSFSRMLTIDASRAKFTNTLDLNHVGNVEVDGGRFDVTGGTDYHHAVVVFNSSRVTFTMTNVIGAGGEGGISFENSNHVTVRNGRFDGLYSAVAVAGVSSGAITGNRITHSFADGIDIGDSHGVTASYNSCSLGTPAAGVHPDCIQLWSVAGHPLESDNIVTHNSATGPTQGFTSFGTGGGALRLSITHNSVSTSYPQGIACYDCIGSTIAYNSVSTMAGAAHVTNINVIGGRHNVVADNDISFPNPQNRAAVVALSAVTTFAAVTGPRGGYGPARDFAGRVDGVNAVPEPGTWALLIAGFAAVGVAQRRVTGREQRVVA